MGRTYAGILGPLAFALVTARSVVLGSGLEASLLAACTALFMFAAAGYFAGTAAEFLIRDTVRSQFQQAMADWNKTRGDKTASDKIQTGKTQLKAIT
jgi:hypothetical protein